jgi:hypothetical protein
MGDNRQRHVLAATGSRSARPTPGLVEELDAFLAERSAAFDLTVISGMAEGWDELVARRCAALAIPFVAAVPHPGYGAYYWSADRSVFGTDRVPEFNELLAKAYEIHYICGGIYDQNGLHSNCARNQWMVDHCDELVAHREGASRGTADCLRRAKKAGRPWVEI